VPLTTVRVTPVSSFFSVIDEPGRTRFCSSCATPSICPVPCAATDAADRATSTIDRVIPIAVNERGLTRMRLSPPLRWAPYHNEVLPGHRRAADDQLSAHAY